MIPMVNGYLLIALFFCHFLADFTQLSRPWMLKAKATGEIGFAILAHAAVHAVLMTAVIGVYCFQFDVMAYAFLIQFASHFAIDVWKGKMNLWVPKVKDTTKYPHWILFGFDQFLHAYFIITIAGGTTKYHLNSLQ